nr:unnamed protein product [Spirometra erinaceieuropaei]
MSHAPAAARTRSTTKYSSLVSAGIYLTLSQAAITGICSRLGAIEANIQQLRQMDRGPPVSVLPTTSLPLALERMSDFDIFEENILRDDYRQEMMAFLQTVGGNTVLITPSSSEPLPGTRLFVSISELLTLSGGRCISFKEYDSKRSIQIGQRWCS